MTKDWKYTSFRTGGEQNLFAQTFRGPVNKAVDKLIHDKDPIKFHARFPNTDWCPICPKPPVPEDGADQAWVGTPLVAGSRPVSAGEING